MGARLLLGGLLISSTGVRAASDKATLQWQPVPDARAYAVEVATDAAFAHVIHSARSPQPTLTWKPEGAGVYYIRVASIDAWQRTGAYSSPTRLIATYTSPTLLAPPAKASLAATAPYRFTWEKVAGTTTYQLELASTADFAKPVLTRTRHRDPYATLKLPPGHYYWRVGAIYADGLPMIYGPARSVTVQPPPPTEVVATTRRLALLAAPVSAAAPLPSLSLRSEATPAAGLADARFDFGLAPMLYHYELTGQTPSTRVTARLYSSAVANAQLHFASGWGLASFLQRASAPLFKDAPPSGLAAAQPNLDLTSINFALLATRDYSLGKGRRVEARLGYLRKSLPLLYKTDGRQLALHNAVLHGLLVGIGTRLPLNQSFALEAQCDYDHPLVATGTGIGSGWHLLTSLGATQVLSSDFYLRYAGLFEYGHLQIQDALLGLDGSLSERRNGVAASLGWMLTP